jgi:hypothetical protein
LSAEFSLDEPETGRQSDVAAFFFSRHCISLTARVTSQNEETDMQGMGEGGDCPFEFNFDPATFKPGDEVSYRVTGSLEGFPFVGTLVEVHDDYVIIAGDANDPNVRYRGTRESRPLVDESEVKAG